jgi:excisionase family DNA binding protein
MVTAAEGAERSYYSISQAAAALGVSRVSIWRWINAGFLPVARLGHRTARISRADLDRIVAERVVGTGSRVPGPAAPADPAPTVDWSRTFDAGHFVQFYERESTLISGVSHYVSAALTGADAAVVVATEPHRQVIMADLTRSGIDVEQALDEGRFQALDAAQTLGTFMVDESPDGERFFEVVGAALDRAVASCRRVRVFGEMVALLVEAGNYSGAVELEALWNDLQEHRPFTLYCAYPIAEFGSANLASTMERVTAHHGRVIPAESFTERASDDERARSVAKLQQQARALEAELAQREVIEDRLRVALAAEQSARASAEDALRMRDEFMSIASHELKTPLTTLSGYAQLVLRRFSRQGELDQPRVVEALESIKTQADKLGRLLGHLLDLSRLDEGKLSLERTPTDVSALVEDVVRTARGWSTLHQIRLGAPTMVRANVDDLRLEQVLVNLIDNAVKYSPDGGPIDVAVSQSRRLVEISVRDHGLGIPVDQRGQIFERFYQAHTERHRSGLGLGLFISRQIVELHGGRIRAEFPRGGGTRFVVRLPLAMPRRRVRRTGLQLVAD